MMQPYDKMYEFSLLDVCIWTLETEFLRVQDYIREILLFITKQLFKLQRFIIIYK